MGRIRSRILGFSGALATVTALLAGCGQGVDVPEETTITFPPDAPMTTTGAPVSESEPTEPTEPVEPSKTSESSESAEPSETGEPGAGDCVPGVDCGSRP